MLSARYRIFFSIRSECKGSCLLMYSTLDGSFRTYQVIYIE